MERAASALLRLTRQSINEAIWRDFHAVFLFRTTRSGGTGTLCPTAGMLLVDNTADLPTRSPRLGIAVEATSCPWEPRCAACSASQRC